MSVLQRHSYGWKRDLPDQRDHLYRAPEPIKAALPPMVDLTPHCPPVMDQLSLGSCTANALAAALQFDQMKQGLSPVFVPSRLFIYYCERAIEGTIQSDSGAELRDGMKSVNQQGACSESLWPYDISQFTVQPVEECYYEAQFHPAIAYQRVAQDIQEMKGCLADGYPFVLGFTVYESFESVSVAQTGVVPMPSTSEAVLGGHAVLAIGYSDDDQRFTAQNSWGTSWGMQGRFTIPFDYLTNPQLASDLWTIRTVQ